MSFEPMETCKMVMNRKGVNEMIIRSDFLEQIMNKRLQMTK